MDWNLKTPNWDFSECGQGNIQSVDGVSGSSSFKGDFSVDLKLGQVFATGNEFEENLKTTNVSKLSLSSTSGSVKRARPAVGSGVHMPSCLVDGCNADLNSCREYHRRHKVCEVHSKTSEVTINGNKQRFCQQCSRFHSPDEFDEGKRSCRKRLDGHNRRRRKPQPETLSHSPNLFSSSQGTTILQFSGQVYPTSPITNPIWDGLVKTEDGVNFYNPHSQSQLPHKPNSFSESSSISNKGSINQFKLFDNNLKLNTNNHFNSRQASSTCQPLLNTITCSETSSISSTINNTDHKMVCDRDGVLSRDCALSLLSSSSTQTSCVVPSIMMPPSLTPTGHMLDAAVAYSSLEPMESALVHNGAGDANVHFQGMFHMAAPRASRDNETPQTLPFYWE